MSGPTMTLEEAWKELADVAYFEEEFPLEDALAFGLAVVAAARELTTREQWDALEERIRNLDE